MIWIVVFAIACSVYSLTPSTCCAAEEDVTYIIPIEGVIEKALLYVIRRGIQQAEQEKAGAIIMVMDTPGGRLDATTEIVRLLLRVKIPTYTFVKSQAFSAGAIIALSTDYIYMAPGSVIGDAMPIMVTPLGSPQQMPEALEEKSVSAVCALIRSAAQQKGHDPELAEAMVRREKEFKIGEKVICPLGQLLTLTNTEAEQKTGRNENRLLSSGTVKDVNELLEKIGRADKPCFTLEVTAAERIARVIASLSVFLLAAGLLGLYIEFKTPGFGLPGILGIICLIIFFWGHHIAGLAGMEELLIFFAGSALLLIEILVIPGFGVVGITGLILMAWGLFSAMLPRLRDISWQFSPSWQFQGPLLTFTGSLVLFGIAIYFLAPHLSGSKLLGRLILTASDSRKAGFNASPQNNDLIGLKGRAITPLHPAGRAEFGDRQIDVITRSEFFDIDTPLQIVEVHGKRIIVEKEEGA